MWYLLLVCVLGRNEMKFFVPFFWVFVFAGISGSTSCAPPPEGYYRSAPPPCYRLHGAEKRECRCRVLGDCPDVRPYRPRHRDSVPPPRRYYRY